MLYLSSIQDKRSCLLENLVAIQEGGREITVLPIWKWLVEEHGK